eukprot:212789-Amphidinium_carterae.1
MRRSSRPVVVIFPGVNSTNKSPWGASKNLAGLFGCGRKRALIVTWASKSTWSAAGRPPNCLPMKRYVLPLTLKRPTQSRGSPVQCWGADSWSLSLQLQVLWYGDAFSHSGWSRCFTN